MMTRTELRNLLSEEVLDEEMIFSNLRREYIASLCPDINIGLDLYKAVDIASNDDADFHFKVTPNNAYPQRHVVVTYNFNLDRYVVLYDSKFYTDYNDFVPALVFAVVQMLSDHRKG